MRFDIQRIFYCLWATEIGHCAVCIPNTQMSFWMIFNSVSNGKTTFCLCQKNTRVCFCFNRSKNHTSNSFPPIRTFHSIPSEAFVSIFAFGWSLFFISFNFHLNRIFIVQLAWLLELLQSSAISFLWAMCIEPNRFFFVFSFVFLFVWKQKKNLSYKNLNLIVMLVLFPFPISIFHFTLKLSVSVSVSEKKNI